jgi:hypothetical protein
MFQQHSELSPSKYPVRCCFGNLVNKCNNKVQIQTSCQPVNYKSVKPENHSFKSNELLPKHCLKSPTTILENPVQETLFHFISFHFIYCKIPSIQSRLQSKPDGYRTSHKQITYTKMCNNYVT